MNQRVTTFLEGDLLERYLMGTTSPIESQEVEHYIAKYPEVKETYNELQKNLEDYASSYAVAAPEELKTSIMKSIKAKPKKERIFPWIAVVACGVAVIFSFVTYLFWDQNQALMEDRYVYNELLEQLSDDIVSNRESLQSVEEQFMILNSTETQKYIMRGNTRARKLEMVAYVNELEKKSYVNVVALPELPDDQVYQMWAEVDGKLRPLDILKMSKDNLVEIPYRERMASLNITIEPKGGSKETTEESVVSKVSF
ncbi:anti-sigma factor [Dokdonia sinensis]|uniref:Anti-sigma factor n=1 Tax=Dokdonia sinensis TaxID=2479847 RepID=A0A3M0GHY8_9FLAO|nr:anti-sigma factor [Dokdonia sinensis]RMB63888.1 anti-sigma factor [Dokdonia sinensis]